MRIDDNFVKVFWEKLKTSTNTKFKQFYPALIHEIQSHLEDDDATLSRIEQFTKFVKELEGKYSVETSWYFLFLFLQYEQQISGRKNRDTINKAINRTCSKYFKEKNFYKKFIYVLDNYSEFEKKIFQKIFQQIPRKETPLTIYKTAIFYLLTDISNRIFISENRIPADLNAQINKFINSDSITYFNCAQEFFKFSYTIENKDIANSLRKVVEYISFRFSDDQKLKFHYFKIESLKKKLLLDLEISVIRHPFFYIRAWFVSWYKTGHVAQKVEALISQIKTHDKDNDPLEFCKQFIDSATPIYQNPNTNKFLKDKLDKSLKTIIKFSKKHLSTGSLDEINSKLLFDCPAKNELIDTLTQNNNDQSFKFPTDKTEDFQEFTNAQDNAISTYLETLFSPIKPIIKSSYPRLDLNDKNVNIQIYNIVQNNIDSLSKITYAHKPSHFTDQDVECLQQMVKDFKKSSEKIQTLRKIVLNPALREFYVNFVGTLSNLFIGTKAVASGQAGSSSSPQDTFLTILGGALGQFLPATQLLTGIIQFFFKKHQEKKSEDIASLTITHTDAELFAQNLAIKLIDRLTDSIVLLKSGEDGIAKLSKAIITKLVALICAKEIDRDCYFDINEMSEQAFKKIISNPDLQGDWCKKFPTLVNQLLKICIGIKPRNIGNEKKYTLDEILDDKLLKDSRKTTLTTASKNKPSLTRSNSQSNFAANGKFNAITVQYTTEVLVNKLIDDVDFLKREVKNLKKTKAAQYIPSSEISNLQLQNTPSTEDLNSVSVQNIQPIHDAPLTTYASATRKMNGNLETLTQNIQTNSVHPQTDTQPVTSASVATSSTSKPHHSERRRTITRTGTLKRQLSSRWKPSLGPVPRSNHKSKMFLNTRVPREQSPEIEKLKNKLPISSIKDLEKLKDNIALYSTMRNEGAPFIEYPGHNGLSRMKINVFKGKIIHDMNDFWRILNDDQKLIFVQTYAYSPNINPLLTKNNEWTSQILKYREENPINPINQSEKISTEHQQTANEEADNSQKVSITN